MIWLVYFYWNCTVYLSDFNNLAFINCRYIHLIAFSSKFIKILVRFFLLKTYSKVVLISISLFVFKSVFIFDFTHCGHVILALVISGEGWAWVAIIVLFWVATLTHGKSGNMDTWQTLNFSLSQHRKKTRKTGKYGWISSVGKTTIASGGIGYYV